MDNGYHEFDITALVKGELTVFASVEFAASDPPRSIEIAGITYLRVGDERRPCGLEGVS